MGHILEKKDSWPFKMGPMIVLKRQYRITTMCCIISQKSIDIEDLHVYDFM